MQEKIKVVEIINCLSGKGGAEVMFCQLCDELFKSDQIDLKVIILHGNIHEDYKQFIESHKESVFCCNKNKRIDVKANKIFKEIINNFNPNIINMHLSCILTYFLSFGFRKRKWTIIQTIHNLCKKDSNFCERILKIPYVRNDILKFIGITSVISKSINDFYENSKIYTIYNGTKIVDNFEDYCYENKKYDLICVARFSKQKNHRLLLEIFNEIYKINNSFTLLLVGGGELFAETKVLVNDMECKTNVFFTGIVSDVHQLLDSARAFILTSNYEGNPISVLEAMSHGLPVVTRPVGGIPDIVSADINGIFISSLDAKKEAKKISKFLGNKALLKAISRNNKELVQKYSIENCAINYLNIFKEISSEYEKC